MNNKKDDNNHSSKSSSIAIPNSKHLDVSKASPGRASWTSNHLGSLSKQSIIKNEDGRSIKNGDSHVLIDIGSPNFKTKNASHHDKIVNSLRNTYFNDAMRRQSTTSTSSEQPKNHSQERSNSTSESEISDDYDRNLNTEGGDVTRDIFKIATSTNNKGHLSTRRKSMEDLTNAEITGRRQSTASALNVPGGFRREFIVQKLRNDQLNGNGTANVTPNVNAREYGTSVSQGLQNTDIESEASGSGNDFEAVPFVTRNFLEFLYIYGHFAGESFEDDFVNDSADSTRTSETSPLLRSRIGSRKELSGKTIQMAKGQTPTKKAFLLLLKSFMGTGVLFLPNAFSNGGLLFSILMLAFFGMYSYWCYFMLIKSKQLTGVSSFGDIGLKLYGKWMKYIILLSLVLSQIGFSGAYVIFTAKNLKAFCESVFHIEEVKLKYLMILQLIIFIPLSFVRNVSKLSLPSLLANFFIMAGLVIVLFFTIKHFTIDLGMTPEVGVVKIFNSNHWTVFVGTAIFAFEGIGLIIPIQDSMKYPEHFPAVLGLVILTATALFILIGTIGYLAYGQYIETVILLNLPQSNIAVNLIQLLYSVAIMLSTPLQLFPAIKIIENKFFPYKYKVDRAKAAVTADGTEISTTSGKMNSKIKWMKNFLRSLIVSLVIFIAYHGYNNLDKFVSIIGSFACIPLVYMYPPMLHLRSNSIPNSVSGKFNWAVWFDYLLIAFGGVSMVYTSYQSITT